MRSERQALADIAKLCDEAEYDPNHPGYVVSPSDVRLILGDVEFQPKPAGGAIDRDAAREMLKRQETYVVDGWHEDLLDALEGCVRPVPASGTIDRDALIAIIGGHWFPQYTDAQRADAVLALVRPVEGVVLTREDAALAVYALRHVEHYPASTPYGEQVHRDNRRALAERLEAAS